MEAANSRMMMRKVWIGKMCALAVLGTARMTGATEIPPKELVAYIQSAKRLGLGDDQIRRNAASAGWSPALVDEAFVANARQQPQGSDHLPAPPVLPGDYRIGPGDVLAVSVWKEPDASVPSVAVRSDGRISLPLVKEVAIAGLTPAEAEHTIAARLGRYIHGADVTIIVSQVNSRKVYMVGGLRMVGSIDMKGGMTILQAITQAGGLTDYAKRKHIYVLRSENGRQVKLPFNYDAVIKGERMEQNILLQANDTVVVPQ